MIIPTQLSEVKFEQIFTSNDNIKHKLANGTPCGGQYIVLKDNVSFKLENWNGYEVNGFQSSISYKRYRINTIHRSLGF